MIRIRFFASLQDETGSSRLEVPYSQELTVEGLFRRLLGEYPGLSRFQPALLVAINEEYAEWNQPLKDGDEVAFFPPVSGGEGTSSFSASTGGRLWASLRHRQP